MIVADQHDAMRVLVDEVADFADVSLGDESAAMQQDDVWRERLDLVEDVAGDDDAAAGSFEAADRIEHVSPRDGIGAGEGLVEKEDLRLVDEGLGQLGALRACPWNSRGSAGSCFRSCRRFRWLFRRRPQRLGPCPPSLAQVWTKS